MIWNVKKKPQLGDTRRGWRFSFFPTKIADKWYWLEFYEVEEIYISRSFDSWQDNKFWHCGELIEDRNIPVKPIPPMPSLATKSE